jgi:hypothetical protein
MAHERTHKNGHSPSAILVLTLALTITVAIASPAPAQDRTFGGYDCTADCSSHSAGYKWAERRDITDEDDCPDGNSQSFHEGCVAYTQGQVADPNKDDDDDTVGHGGRRSMPADDDDDN